MSALKSNRTGPWVLFTLSILAASAHPGYSAPVKDFRLEYRKTPSGAYTAILHNDHSAAVTAYIAQAAYDESGRERHTSLGGDTLGFTNGQESELPAHRDMDTGHSLPLGAGPPAATRILAVIYADGATEGEDEVVAMLLAGRHRAYADLQKSIPALEKALGADSKLPSLLALFQSMQARDEAEGESLDELQDAPGRMRYRFFLSAVPAQGMQFLQAGEPPAQLLARFRVWRDRLAASKPDVK